jgi:abelson tyrosine-protein kinase 1
MVQSNFHPLKRESGLPSPDLNPRWFPPEVSVCKKLPLLSKKSDIWSLGMTFLELLTGESPFSEISQNQEVMHAHTRGILPKRPANPTAIGAEMNNEMWDLLHRCWKKPKSRPKIEEVKGELASIRKGLRGPYTSLSFLPQLSPVAYTVT